MVGKTYTGRYVPGTYAKRRSCVEERVGHYVRTWENRQLAQEEAERAAAAPSDLPLRLAFSRRIGVGALELAGLAVKGHG